MFQGKSQYEEKEGLYDLNVQVKEGFKVHRFKDLIVIQRISTGLETKDVH